MELKEAKAVRRRVSWIMKRGKDCGSKISGSILLYWMKVEDCSRKQLVIEGHECKRYGLGKGIFCIWRVDSDEKWDMTAKQGCHPFLKEQLEELIKEVNGEKEAH